MLIINIIVSCSLEKIQLFRVISIVNFFDKKLSQLIKLVIVIIFYMKYKIPIVKFMKVSILIYVIHELLSAKLL